MQEEQKLGAGGKSDRRKREMLFLIKKKRREKVTQNPALWIQIRSFNFATFVLIVSRKWKRNLIILTLNFSCFVFVLDYLLFSLHIIPEQNDRLSKHRRKNGDCLSTEVLLIHEITTQILNSITAHHYWEIWLIQKRHIPTYARVTLREVWQK